MTQSIQAKTLTLRDVKTKFNLQLAEIYNMELDSESNNKFTKAHFDFNNLPQLTNPWRQLNLQGVALGLIRLPAGDGYTFTHSHAEQEEVYIVVEGKGLMVVDGELLTLDGGDIVRVSPAAERALKAADNTDLFVLCTGGLAAGYPKQPNARYLIDDGIPDYDDVPPWYEGNPEITERNVRLKERMLKAQAKRESQQELQ